MDEGRAMLIKVGLMCLLVVPCWFLHRELVPPPGMGWYPNLFFFFFGPIAAGFYAGSCGKNFVIAVYSIVASSTVLTVLYSILWLGDMFYFELLLLMGQLFALLSGLLLVGSGLALLFRRIHV